MCKTAGFLLIAATAFAASCSSAPSNQPATTNQPSPAASQSATAAATSSPAQAASPGSAAAKPSVDACTLLTSDEIQAVQGEPVRQAKPSNRVAGEFTVTQCYYELPTASNSISLTLTESNSGNRAELKKYWEETFGKDENKSEKERKKERDAKKAREGEEEEGAPLEPVRGVGDEAFWAASSVGGALYVLKRDRYIRISVGGKGNVESKLRKSKMLAQKALQKL